MYLILTVVMLLTFQSNADSEFGTLPDTCLADKSKTAPSTDTVEYVACKSWENKTSCCTKEQGRSLQEDGTTGMKYMTTICGEFTPKCRQYLVAVGCFYQCEPMLQHYQDDDVANAPRDAPVCGKYCDEWFQACKDDKTCMDDWQQGITLNGGTRDCPADGSTCARFADMFDNGEDLCNTMHGFNFRYEASNKNCMVMMFDDDDNPNVDGDPYGNSANHVTASLLIWLSVLFFVYY